MEENKEKTTTKTKTTKKTTNTKSGAKTKKNTNKSTSQKVTPSSAKKTTSSKKVTPSTTSKPKKSTKTSSSTKTKQQSSKSTATQTSKTKKTTPQKPSPKKTIVKEEPEKTKEIPKVQEIEEKIEVVEEVEPETKSSIEHTIIFDGSEDKNLAEVVNKLEEENVIIDNKVIKRSPVRKTIITILYILIILVIIISAYYVVNNEKNKNINNQTVDSEVYKKVSKNYDTIDDIKEDTITSEKTYSNIENIGLGTFETKAYNKENIHVLIASSTCYACAIYEETVNNVYKEHDDVIYRIDINLLTTEELTRFRTYYAFNSTPTIFSLKDGVVSSEILDNQSKEELSKWYENNK